MNTSGVMSLLLWLLSASAIANDAPYPDRPIHMIVPGGPGGVIDIRARWLAERLAPILGEPVVVEDKPGAGGNIGTEFGAHSRADGYTIVVVHQGTMTMNPHLYRRTGYDPRSDLVPITRVGVGPLVLAVNPKLPVRNVHDLVALAKAHPGRMTFGSPGVGTPPHLAAALFQRTAGIELVHVPYRGGAQAVSDLVAGHIDMSIEGTGVQLPFVESGQLRPLAVTGRQRLPSLPDVPTMQEAGIAGYEFEGWVGLAVPAGTPAAIVDRLYRATASVLATPEAQAWLARYALAPGGEPPELVAELVRDEYAKWGAIIREAHISAE